MLFYIFIFKTWGNIWNRLTRANIYIKGIYLLNDYTLNLYKNYWDDVWFNTIIHRVSFSFLLYERIGYIYLSNGKGVGTARTNTEISISELIFLLKHYHNRYLILLFFYFSKGKKRIEILIEINLLKKS